MSSPPVPQAMAHPVITLLLTAGAVALASYRNLQFYIATASLTPPIPSDTEDSTDTKSDATPARPLPSLPPRWRRIAVGVVVGLIVLSYYVVVGYIIPRFAPQEFVDGFFGSLYFIGTWGALYTTLYMIASPEATVSLVHSKNALAPLQLKRSNPATGGTKAIVLFFSLLTSLFLFAEAYQKATWVGTVLAPAFACVFLVNQGHKRLSMRKVSYFIVGYLALVFGTMAILILAFPASNDGEGDSRDEREDGSKDEFLSKLKLPSEWMVALMWPVQGALASVYASFIVTLNLRFDYARTHDLPAPLAPGATATISAVAPFSRPMFNTSFITLFGFAFATLAVTTSLWPEVPTHMIIMIAAAPVVVVVSALTAYFRGEFKSWWAYEETWVPKMASPEDGIAVVDNAESAIEANYVEEKRPLLAISEA